MAPGVGELLRSALMPRIFESVGDWLQDRLGAHPGRPALAAAARYRLLPVSYRELAARVNACRKGLGDLGLSQGDRVVLLGANSIDWVTAWIACVQSGLVVVPLDPQTPDGLLAKILAETRASLAIADNLIDGHSVPSLSFDDLRALASADAGAIALPPAPVKREDLLEIVYTSGTTGTPKGVVLTHANLLANIDGLAAMVKLPFPIRFISTLPLSHMLEQMLGLLFPLSQGCCVIYPYNLWPSRLIGMIKDYGVHAMITVPGLLKAMKDALERDPRGSRRALGWRFRLIGVGGASLPEELERWWSSHGVRVVQGYGLTETAPLISLNTPWHVHRGSVGRPLPGERVRLARDGEILVKGPNASPGYYGKPQETAKLYENGWLRTGDVGEFRGDWLYYRARAKDMIVTSSGSNVYPEDVEAALGRTAGVRDSCVLQWNDKVWAVLLLQPQSEPQRVVELANARLMPHQKIAGASVWPLPDFPRTRLGKIRKHEVLEKLREANSRRRPAEPFSGGKLEEIVCRDLGVSGVAAQARLSDLGLDSLARVALLSDIDEELGVELEETAVTDETTVGELADMIARRQQPPPGRMPQWQLSRLASLVRPVARWLPQKIALAIARPSCSGLENLDGVPAPAIFAVNHQSAWDAAVVLRFLPRRFRKCAIPALPDFFGLAPKRPLWQRATYRAMGLFIALGYRAYPFGPAVGTERSLRQTGRLLDSGCSIMIFPEGGRTPEGKIHTFMAGIGVLAREMSVPIVPVGVQGLHEMLPYPRFVVPVRLGRARVRFASPVAVGRDITPATAAEAVKAAVEALL